MLYTLDATIVNVALPHMQGSLQANQDQIAWVLTSYIVSTAIAMPLTGWLGTRFGLRKVLTISVLGFTVGSMGCGLATSLGQMIFFRLAQGIFGAALVPLSQVALLQEYPAGQQARVLLPKGGRAGPAEGKALHRYAVDFRAPGRVIVPVARGKGIAAGGGQHLDRGPGLEQALGQAAGVDLGPAGRLEAVPGDDQGDRGAGHGASVSRWWSWSTVRR